VKVDGVLGNTGANGEWEITVLSPTTFSLVGSVGNGAFTSGGFVAANDLWWFLELDATKRITLQASSEMPEVPHIRAIYADGMRAEWAKRQKRFDEAREYRGYFEDALAHQGQAVTTRVAGANFNLGGVKIRPNYPRRGR
jgi:hypothetical protein